MPPRRRTVLAAAVLAALAPVVAAPGGGSIRCEGGLVSAGDTKLDLLGKCGRPALVERRAVQRTGTLLGQGLGLVARQEAEATIETWTYDFGPQVLLRVVELEDGVVTRVDTGGHGYSR